MKSFKDKLNSAVSAYDSTPSLPSKATLAMAAQALNMTFGPILKEYLSSFGYLGCGAVELYGINESQGLNSDMVKTTLNILEFAPSCSGYAVIDNRGDGIYVLCDSNDRVFVMPDNPSAQPRPLGLCLDDYIISRLNG